MKAFRTVVIMTLLIPVQLTLAQGKKKVKKYNIATYTATDYEDGRTFTNRKKVFNKDGETLEEYDYNRYGQLVAVDIYKYDKEGNELEHLKKEPPIGKATRSETKYNGLGEKSEEHVFDQNGNKLKTYFYTYDSRGLKTERKTVDPAGNVISIRKYTYTFN